MINKREIEMERRNPAEAIQRPMFCIGRQPDREQRRRYPLHMSAENYWNSLSKKDICVIAARFK